VVRTRSSHSKDKVRIAAGAIVLPGVLLAQFLNSTFMWLSGLFGERLFFAGLPDWGGVGDAHREDGVEQRGAALVRSNRLHETENARALNVLGSHLEKSAKIRSNT